MGIAPDVMPFVNVAPPSIDCAIVILRNWFPASNAPNVSLKNRPLYVKCSGVVVLYVENNALNACVTHMPPAPVDGLIDWNCTM